MSDKRMVFVATILSLVGGAWNISTSIGMLPSFPWSLTSISGVVTLFAAIFMYWDSHNRRLWGAIIFFYSNLGFIAYALDYSSIVHLQGLLTLILGVIGGALGISQKEAASSH